MSKVHSAAPAVHSDPVGDFPSEEWLYAQEHGVFPDELPQLPLGCDFELSDLESYYEPEDDDREAVAAGRTVADFGFHAVLVNEGAGEPEMTEPEPSTRDEPRGPVRKARRGGMFVLTDGGGFAPVPPLDVEALASEPGVTMTEPTPGPGAWHLMAVEAVAEGRAAWRPYIDEPRRVVCLSGLSFAEACWVTAAANAARHGAELTGADPDPAVYAAQRQALALVLSRREGGGL